MSRGFVKESDQEDLPIVPPRADLPAGMVNYVTEVGYTQLIEERDQLLLERDSLTVTDENERRITLNFINAKLDLLNERIASAKVVDLSKQPKDKVRFGAEVFFTVDSDPKIHHYQIVGVDEANIAKGKIAFTSPIAKIFMDRKVGDTAKLKLEKGEKLFKIVEVRY